MNTQATTQWRRVKICGILETLSPLHIGNGTTEPQEPLTDEANTEAKIRLLSAVCSTDSGIPYLPASSLRGALRARVDPAFENSLFGSPRENGGMGKLRYYDALANRSDLQLRTGIAINPLLGVVDNHKLFTRQVVPVGTRFSLEIEADNLTESELAVVLGLLQSLDGSAGSGVGGGKSKDQGRMRWQCDKIESITTRQLADWCQQPQAHLPWQNLTLTPDPRPPVAKGASLAFTVEFLSPWLVDEPTRHIEKENEQHNPPHLEFYRTEHGKALLPASSLKGWLRAQARRICVTQLVVAGLSVAAAGETAEHWLAEIFGSTSKASWLRVSDAISREKVAPHLQQFNAIDRFTGGGKEGALYSVNAAPPARLHGQMALSGLLPQNPDWRFGLLAWVARDAMEDDLRLGWGKSRGYGRARLLLPLPNGEWADWPALVAHWGDALLPHLREFQNKVAQATEAEHV